MSLLSPPKVLTAEPNFPRGGGEMASRIAAHDWAATPLGPIEAWPQSLRTAVEICLASGFASYVWWGPELVQIYNDAAIRIIRGKHPAALGAPAAEAWSDVWGTIGAVAGHVLATGETAVGENKRLIPDRGGPREEAWFNFSYSALRDESGAIAGLFATAIETTPNIVAERRLIAERERLVRMYEQAPGFIALVEGPEHVFTVANAAFRALIGRDPVGLPIRAALPEVEGQGYFELLDRARATGEPVRSEAAPVRLRRGPDAALEERHVDFLLQPLIDEAGRPSGIFVQGSDVTDRVRSEARLRTLTDNLPVAMVYQLETARDVSDRVYRYVSGNCERLTGIPLSRALGDPAALLGAIDPAELPGVLAAEAVAARDLTMLDLELTGLVRGEARAFHIYSTPRLLPDGRLLWDGLLLDVTERRSAEKALADNEARLRLLASAVPNFVWFAAADGTVHFLNERWRDYTGLTLDQSTEDGWAEVVHPDDRDRVAEVWGDALARGTPYEVECRYRRHDGEWRWYVARAEPFRGAGGRIVSWFGTSTDIHDLKLAEAALQASEERLRDLTDALPVLISYLDRDHVFRFANKAYETWFGRPLAEIVGLHARELMGEAMYEVRRPWLDRALAGEAVVYDGVFTAGPLPRFTVIQHIPHVGPGGDVLGVYALVQDMTEMKRIEAELRDSRDRLEAVLDATPAAILIATDPDCSVIHGNARAIDLMRMPSGGNLSKSTTALTTRHFRVLTPDGRELGPQELPVQRAARGEELFMHEEQVHFEDGSALHLLGNAVPLRDGEGRLRGAVGAFIDISERKAAEQRQKLLIDELNHRVKNTLAVVQGIAQQTFKGSEVPVTLRDAFEGRLSALSVAHELLTQANWEMAPMRHVVAGALTALGIAGERAAIAGPDLMLPPKTSVSLAMAVHELATNAIKYGALSVPEGRVTVAWRVHDRRLTFTWTETGGPPVTPPTRRGFGTRLIERGLAAELRGKVEMRFLPEGLVCEVDAPAP